MFNQDLCFAWGMHPMQFAFAQTLMAENEAWVPARVVFASHEQFRLLLLGTEREVPGRLRGRFFNEGLEFPAVGDWVMVELVAGDFDALMVEEVLPRTSSLNRAVSDGYETLAANITRLGIVTSFNEDFNLKRLERGLAMARDSGAEAFVILNKSDLVDAGESLRLEEEVRDRFGDVPMFRCSAERGLGIEELKNHFGTGETIAFLGMSGVGKSTLINALVKQNLLETKGIRESDSRGRHTTTHRELFLTSMGFWLMDNPGIRAFSFAGDQEVLDDMFEDIAELFLRCRFTDCAHETEPGCRIVASLEDGSLDPSRWENYLKMRAEARFHENKFNKAFQSQQRKAFAKRNKDLKQHLKMRRK